MELTLITISMLMIIYTFTRPKMQKEMDEVISRIAVFLTVIMTSFSIYTASRRLRDASSKCSRGVTCLGPPVARKGLLLAIFPTSPHAHYGRRHFIALRTPRRPKEIFLRCFQQKGPIKIVRVKWPGKTNNTEQQSRRIADLALLLSSPRCFPCSSGHIYMAACLRNGAVGSRN